MVHAEPGKRGKFAIFMKSQGKPGIVREFSIIFIQVKEKSRKTDYVVSISFHKLLHGYSQSSCSICCQ